MRRRYPYEPTPEIARDLDRSVPSVEQQAWKLGLRKSEAFLEGPHSGRRRKGQAPANKGRPQREWMPPASRKRCQATQFKAGRAPQESPNYLPIGWLRVCADGYLERKVTDDQDLYPARRWVAVHRLVWEAAHGPIPPGHAVVFKPGMRTIVESDITVDRLECITRAELMRRNSLHNYPKPVADLIRLRGALTRQINKRTSQ